MLSAFKRRTRPRSVRSRSRRADWKTWAFCGGFDLNVLRAGGPDAQKMLFMGFELAYRMLSLPAPIVVACSGHAIAMGVFLVLSADYRMGADGPFRIGANEVAIGLTMPHFAIEMCRQRLAPAHFNRAVIFSEMFAPADAVPAGFLDKVVPAAELQNEAQKLAATMAKLNSDVLAASKLRLRASNAEGSPRRNRRRPQSLFGVILTKRATRHCLSS